MKDYDQALHFSNPRLLCAIYFGVLSVVGTVLIDAFLTLLGIEELVPLYQSVILGMVISSATGALCGKVLIHSRKPFISKVFAIGFFMVLGSLPIFTLSLCVCTDPRVQLFLVRITFSYCLWFCINLFAWLAGLRYLTHG